MQDIHENTICYKIERIEDLFEAVAKKGEALDIQEVLKQLRAIRKSATRMENGLKLRKKIMEEHKLEEQYQKEKGDEYKPTGINTVRGSERLEKRRIKFKITVEEQGKIVYQNETFGAVVSVVERIEDMDNFGVIDGKAQTFLAGHPLTIFFAFDQLRQAFREKEIDIMTSIRQAVLSNKFSDPRVRKQIVDAMGGEE